MEEKEVLKVDKKNIRTLTIIFNSGICEHLYDVVDINFEDEYINISSLTYNKTLVRQIYKKDSVLSLRMEFTNAKVIVIGDEKDGE